MDYPLENSASQIPETEVNKDFLNQLIERFPHGFIKIPKLIKEHTRKTIIFISLLAALGLFAEKTYSLGSFFLNSGEKKISGMLGAYPDEGDDVCSYDKYTMMAGPLPLTEISAGAVKQGSQAANFIEKTGGTLVCSD